MRFLIPVLAVLALSLPSTAEAGRGIPIVRGTEEHLAFVADTRIPGPNGRPLALCHYYEVNTLYHLGIWMSSNGYVLSGNNCLGTGYYDQPQAIAAAFAAGEMPAGVPATPAFSLRQRAEGHAWIGIGLALVLFWLARRILGGLGKRKSRIEERMEVLGLPDNAVFRFIDAMLHAAKADGRAHPEEIEFIRRKATEIAQLDYTDEHIGWAIEHTDKLKTPRDFQRFGKGLTTNQARMVLRAALAVVAADGVMSRAERRFIAQLTSGLMLDIDEVNRILGPAPGEAPAAA